MRHGNGSDCGSVQAGDAGNGSVKDRRAASDERRGSKRGSPASYWHSVPRRISWRPGIPALCSAILALWHPGNPGILASGHPGRVAWRLEAAGGDFFPRPPSLRSSPLPNKPSTSPAPAQQPSSPALKTLSGALLLAPIVARPAVLPLSLSLSVFRTLPPSLSHPRRALPTATLFTCLVAVPTRLRRALLPACRCSCSFPTPATLLHCSLAPAVFSLLPVRPDRPALPARPAHDSFIVSHPPPASWLPSLSLSASPPSLPRLASSRSAVHTASSTPPPLLQCIAGPPSCRTARRRPLPPTTPTTPPPAATTR
jgi:hypothetical protein